MKKLVIVLLCLSLGACAANSVARVSAPSVEMDAEVYAAILEKLFPVTNGKVGRQFVINRSAEKYSRDKYVQEYWDDVYRIPGVDSGLVANWVDTDSGRADLMPLAGALEKLIGVKVVMISGTELGRITSAPVAPDSQSRMELPWWRNFYKAFPGSFGHVSFSTIGYNADFTKALVDVAHGCGGMCGQGTIVLLQRLKGKWVVVQTKGTWVV